MRVRKQDLNGDYTLGTGADFYVNTPAAVAQAAMTRLKLYTGEWFLDVTDGTPWRTEVLGKYTQKSYDAVIKQRILATPGVNSITQYASTFDGKVRKLTISLTLDTIYGAASTQGTL